MVGTGQDTTAAAATLNAKGLQGGIPADGHGNQFPDGGAVQGGRPAIPTSDWILSTSMWSNPL